MEHSKNSRYLILVRHALAQDKNEAQALGVIDFDRPLVSKGVKRAKKMAKRVRRYLNEPSHCRIVTSPSFRCLQTAKIVEACLQKKNGSVEFAEDMKIEAHQDLLEYSQALQRHVYEWSISKESESHLIVVGHEPLLGLWVTELLKHEGFIDRMSDSVNSERESLLHWPKAAFMAFQWNHELRRLTLCSFQ